MKYKIVEMQDGSFSIYAKYGFLTDWNCHHSDIKSIEEAERKIQNKINYQKKYIKKRIVKIIDTKDLE